MKRGPVCIFIKECDIRDRSDFPRRWGSFFPPDQDALASFIPGTLMELRKWNKLCKFQESRNPGAQGKGLPDFRTRNLRFERSTAEEKRLLICKPPEEVNGDYSAHRGR